MQPASTSVPFPRSAPADQGVDAAGVLAFLDAIESDPRIEPHGLIIQRGGRRIVEGYWAPHTGSTNRLVYSLSKTFTGTALALALGEGLLTLDDLVADHLPEYFEGIDDDSSRTARLRVRHIASMATGHNREMILEAMTANPADPLAGFFGIEPDAEPGTLFAYNQPPVMALAAILTRLTGSRLVDYLRPRVLDPIGIGAASFGWAQQKPGVDLGFSGVYTNLDAIARLGQLYLDDGVLNGASGDGRLLPEGWVADASRPHVANPNEPEIDWRQGYGFQLWIARHGYRGDGAFGQYMVVLPEHGVVIAMFSCTLHMQAVLDAMWTYLLPAFAGPHSASSVVEASASDGLSAGELSSDGSSAGELSSDGLLAERLSRLTLPTASRRIGGRPVVLGDRQPDGVTRLMPEPHGPSSHRTITAIDLAGNHAVIHEIVDGRDATLVLPLTESWSLSSAPAGIAAASAASTGQGHIVVDVAMLHTPHRLELTLDPAVGTFQSHWPIPPLFHAALGAHLTTMVPHA